MEQRLNCNFVQDILPNYIEGLTSDITNKAIQEHLATCVDCRKALDSMTREMQETKGMKVVQQKQINFLKKIKRKQWKIAGINVFISVIVLFGALYFVSNRDFPVSSTNVTISQVYQMNDGSIHYSVSANVKGYISYISRIFPSGDGESEIIRIYEHRRLFSNQSKGIVLLPEKWSSLPDSNANKEKTVIYYEGTDKNDKIIVWMKGMDIPKATAEQEANYKNFRDSK
ncbi:hypothetical protein GCM10008018_31290 [Paenibacillus marchantiophytorum]|uniref:Putative zinc-finger domain-containing protein n=1 Tax=Paenibacillus marchantiophytorum TaxID=1619310 RepID=A0ABQ1ERI7_9BACL|nr:zf-HC2 domain-containing protein [Paenibacillus marchantiophytorum]GFZ83092.1 hypothetical protein GCM10008018_31290 [Paenibacillus marchantiophytorum]